MATFRIVLGIVCLAFLGRAVEPGGFILVELVRRGVVESKEVELLRRGVVESSQRPLNNLTAHQLNPLAIAQTQLGVREATGKNDGVAVEKYLNYTGNKKGEPWCASFVSWVYGQAGFRQPKTAWSPGLFPLARRTLKPQVADVFGIYFPDLGRIAHAGLVENKQGNWLYTIEGNTNVAGSREGDGVYRKLRHLKTIKVYANWVNEPRKEVEQSKLSRPGKLLKISNPMQVVRSLPRGQQTFPLMEKYAKTEPFSELINPVKSNYYQLIDQVRNEASTLKAIAWPAVPVCPKLLGTVLCGELYQGEGSKPKPPNLYGAERHETLIKSFHCKGWLNQPGKEVVK